MKKQEIIISGTHMDLTEALKQTVTEKVERLYRHKDNIIRVRVELGFDNKKGDDVKYSAKGHIEINGPDIHVSETTDDLYKSIDRMIDKLDRKLNARGKSIRHKRKHPHGVEIPADIPKTDMA